MERALSAQEQLAANAAYEKQLQALELANQVAAAAYGNGVPAVQREAPISHNTYNMPGSREAWELYGAPPVMVQSDPYARIAYRQNPDGSFTSLQGFPSVYPHVVRGVADPSLPSDLGMWHWLGQQAAQANPYGALAAQALRAPRRVGSGNNQPPAKDNTGQQAPARPALKPSHGPMLKRSHEQVQVAPTLQRSHGAVQGSTKPVLATSHHNNDNVTYDPVRPVYWPRSFPLIQPPQEQAAPPKLARSHDSAQQPMFPTTQATQTQQTDVQQQVQQAAVQQAGANGQSSGLGSVIQAGLPLAGMIIGKRFGGPVGASIGGLAGTKLAGYFTGNDPSVADYIVSALPMAASWLYRGAPRRTSAWLHRDTFPAGKGAATVSGSTPKPVLPTGNSGAARPVLPGTPVAPALPSAPIPMGTTATPYRTIPVLSNIPTGPVIQMPGPAQSYALPSALQRAALLGGVGTGAAAVAGGVAGYMPSSGDDQIATPTGPVVVNRPILPTPVLPYTPKFQRTPPVLPYTPAFQLSPTVVDALVGR